MTVKAYSPVKGITYLRELAEGGYEWAQFKMGCEYIKGEHVEKDDLQAEEWLRKAVDQGNVPAILLLSNIYYKKRGIRKNSLYDRAFKGTIRQGG